MLSQHKNTKYSSLFSHVIFLCLLVRTNTRKLKPLCWVPLCVFHTRGKYLLPEDGFFPPFSWAHHPTYFNGYSSSLNSTNIYHQFHRSLMYPVSYLIIYFLNRICNIECHLQKIQKSISIDCWLLSILYLHVKGIQTKIWLYRKDAWSLFSFSSKYVRVPKTLCKHYYFSSIQYLDIKLFK